MILDVIGKFLGKTAYDILQELQKIDGDTRMLLLRFLVRAGKSGDPNRFIKQHLQRILDDADAPEPSYSPRQVRVTSREVKK